MDMRVKIDGLNSLATTLAAIPRGVRRKVIMPALREGAAVVRDRAEKNLAEVADKGYSTGVSAQNIRVYSARKYKGAYRVIVMVRRGAVNRNKIVNGEPVRVGLYVSVLEYGKEGQPPAPWIRPAIVEEEQAAKDIVAAGIRKRMDSAIEDAKRNR